MNFPGQGKIPGHSGTAQNHRKAFAGIKEYYRKKARLSASGSQTTEQSNEFPTRRQLQYLQNRRINRLVKAPLLLLILGFIVYGAVMWGGNISYSFQESIENSKFEKIERERLYSEDRYRFFVESGNEFFNKRLYDEAYRDYVQALKIAPYGRSARIGYVSVLKKKCEFEQIFCEEIDINLQFLKEMKYIDEATYSLQMKKSHH
ncbi:MAG: hypothetical protein R2824_20100 [Saprospiraceae bacterium]|nr:hypothetical protein [Lewinella sp.]